MTTTTFHQVEHKLTTAAAIIHKAALDAETLSDQSLADDLHQLHGDLIMRLLPAVRKGKTPRPLVSSSA
jgi:hypothetical protein